MSILLDSDGAVSQHVIKLIQRFTTDDLVTLHAVITDELMDRGLYPAQPYRMENGKKVLIGPEK